MNLIGELYGHEMEAALQLGMKRRFLEVSDFSERALIIPGYWLSKLAHKS